jgi:thymidylate synthase (FAD)
MSKPETVTTDPKNPADAPASPDREGGRSFPADGIVSKEQRAEIDAQRETMTPTRRASVPALEELLYEPIPVLDHGFVRVVDYMGDDAAIVQAARVSYGKGTRKITNDRGLIRYLMRHRHTTPFEMCEIKFHVKLPVFVARQWIRHRTANVNEYSARYSILDREFYIPQPEQLAAQSAANRQGRGEVLEGEEAERVLQLLRDDAAQCYAHYEEMLNEGAEGEPRDPGRQGLARELARMNIRVYAEAMLEVARRWVPIACEAFEDYAVGGARLSRAGLDIVRRMLAGETVTQEDSGLSKREWDELMAVLGKD